MALELVTVEEALAQIRGDEDADGDWLATWIPIVSAAVLTWLKDEWRLYVADRDSDGDIVRDSNGDPIAAEEDGALLVHPAVKGAVLVELASQFRWREGEGDNRVDQQEGHGYVLSKTATALLAGLRKSTVA
jgi:hypothetical protein